MKNLINLETVFTVWAWGLTLITAAGILTAIFNLATGNWSNTASFEF